MLKNIIRNSSIKKLGFPVLRVGWSFVNRIRFPHIFSLNKDFDTMFAEEMKRGFAYTKYIGRRHLNYVPNLDHPQKFNEKLIHRRLFNRNPIWPVVTDKVAVRDWLYEHGLLNKVQLIPCRTVFEDVNEFLPHESDFSFVVKAAWASGYNLFAKNSREWGQTQKKLLEGWQVEAYAPHRLIWSAQHIKRRFIVEDFIYCGSGERIKDFKFFVFHGNVKSLQVHVDRGAGHKILHYDDQLSPIAVNRKGKEFRGSDFDLPPNVFDAAGVAEAIGSYFDFVRVDLYIEGSNIYFGEITQTPANGLGAFDPPTFDMILGKHWNYEARHFS